MVVRPWGGYKRALLCALATVVLYAVMASTVTGPAQAPGFLLGYALAWLFYLYLLSGEVELSPRFILAWALLARLLWVGTEPWLSDDLYRYLLDGRVLVEGINPFRFAPDHPVIRALVPEYAPRVNHPQVPTIYPAVVQLFAAIAALLRLGIVGWRVLISWVDVAVVIAVARLFGGGRDGWRAAAVYGLCPLAILESGANGHVEPLVLLPLALAFRAQRRPLRSGWLLGVATLGKFFPLILAPLWLARPRGWMVSALAALCLTVGTLAFSLGGVDPTVGLRTYLESWSFNGPLFQLLRALFGDGVWLRVLPFLVAAAAAWLASRRGVEPSRGAPAVLALFLLFGPTLHPWYALWLLPWLGPRPDRTLWAFVFAMGLSYAVWWQVHTTGRWELPIWQTVAIWSVVAVSWASTLVRRTAD